VLLALRAAPLSMVSMSPWTAKSPIRPPRNGFGLVEQIACVAVLAVLAMIAIPSFRHLIDSQELRLAQMDYITALQHSRDLAVNEQVRVVFCPSSDALTCNNDGAWSGGWLIGRDPRNKGQPEGAPLYVGGKYSKRLHIVSKSNKKNVQFQPGGSVGTGNQTLVICLRGDDSRALKVVIARGGRVRGDVASPDDVSACAGLD
jgi:type IV fimbrial biogenesis protein FimT